MRTSVNQLYCMYILAGNRAGYVRQNLHIKSNLNINTDMNIDTDKNIDMDSGGQVTF